MKTWLKILIVCIAGAGVWGLSYCASLFPAYAMALSLFSAGLASLCGIITGFSGPKA